MIIHKFGGASIKDAESVKRMVKICESHIKNGVIVVSAMGKTTNLLEQIVQAYFDDQNFDSLTKQLYTYHWDIIKELFPQNHSIFRLFEKIIGELSYKLAIKSSSNYDFEYDQIVHFGELISTIIISEYLNITCPNTWIDIRTCLKTNSVYREAKVNWELSDSLTRKIIDDWEKKLYVTQGFIGSDDKNMPTTLGREGSDFTAAVLAYILDAQKVVVWKNVAGILCADPDWIQNANKIDQLSYLDAIELAYYGAKVIHPKTIKPLQNKKIPLQVRSFLDVANEGTIINSFHNLKIPPVYIKKNNQVLISIKPTDYSFIIEENLSHIFGILAKNQIKVNLMQNSAVSFSIVVDNEMYRVNNGIRELKQYYNVKYNDKLKLITIRHNQPGAEHLVLKEKTILLEQRSRTVARFLVRNT